MRFKSFLERFTPPPPPPPPESEIDSHLNEISLKSKTFEREVSKVRRMFLKFLILAPPAFLFKIKLPSPFQNGNVDLLLNEAYGHTFRVRAQYGSCFRNIHRKFHESESCVKWVRSGNDPGGT